MPRDNIVLGLRGYKIDKVSGGNPVELAVRYMGEVRCPHCASEDLRTKDRFVMKLRHQSFGQRSCVMCLEGRKYQCRSCGRYFNQRFPGVHPRLRSTEVYRRQVFADHKDGISSSRVAAREKIGSATVERWYHDLLGKKVSELSGAPCPVELGMDEHFFTRKRGYATTLCDLKHGRVYDVTLGRSERSLERFFSGLVGRERVRLVCIDLSATYRSIVRRYFPHAKIVADRFHVIRLVNHHFLATWRDLDPPSSRSRGLLSLMRRHEDRLSEEQRGRLARYFEDHPEMGAIWRVKHELCGMFRQKTLSETSCRRLIPRLLSLLEQLKASDFESLVRLGNTLSEWIEEIVRMWRYTKSNGITEGFHNKMETISRRAYGFRNFENYRLRVRAQCC